MELARRVELWTGATPLVRDGVLLIATPNPEGGQRAAARRQIRATVQHVMARIWHVAEQHIGLESAPGQAPRLLLHGAFSAVGLSISHDATVSLAALHLHGAVGVDHMQVQLVPDWYHVARDYLGPASAAQLRHSPAAQRGRDFAQAWTRYEAYLKCAGRGLIEWQPETADQMARYHYVKLVLPNGLSGTLAVPQSNPV